MQSTRINIHEPCVLSEVLCLQEGDMVEMYCTNNAVWAIWRVRDGDLEDTVVQHFTYDGLVSVYHVCMYLCCFI